MTVHLSSTVPFSGRPAFLIEARDPLTHGFVCPRACRDLLRQPAGDWVEGIAEGPELARG